MYGKLCVIAGLILLGALCFPMLATADFQKASDTSLVLNLTEAASSAKSVVNQDEVDRLIASIVENSFALVGPDKSQEYPPNFGTSYKPDDNQLAGVFRRRNGELRQPLRNTLRGSGRLLGRGGCG